MIRISRPRASTAAALVFVCIAALGCKKEESGGDDTGGTGGVPAGTGGIVAPGTGGTVAPGTGGATGTGGMTGTGGAPAAVMMCGGTMCMPPAGSPLMSCCLPDMTCGLGVGMECGAVMAPGTADTTCPSHMSPTGSMLAGCCKPDMMCGVMSMAGLGCVERSAVAMFAGGPLTACACGGDGSACGSTGMAGMMGTGGTGTGGMGTGGTGTGGTGTGGSGTGGSGTGGSGTVSAGCMTYCTCMAASCASSTFPSSRTCQTHCATASPTALTCWNTHCNNVASMGASHCAHALGDGAVCPAQ